MSAGRKWYVINYWLTEFHARKLCSASERGSYAHPPTCTYLDSVLFFSHNGCRLIPGVCMCVRVRIPGSSCHGHEIHLLHPVLFRLPCRCGPPRGLLTCYLRWHNLRNRDFHDDNAIVAFGMSSLTCSDLKGTSKRGRKEGKRRVMQDWNPGVEFEFVF